MKKIDEKILEKVQLLCYEVLLFGVIDLKSMHDAKEIALKYLIANEFDIHEVKCDLENNTHHTIDNNHIIIDIYEVVNPGSVEYKHHQIVL